MTTRLSRFLVAICVSLSMVGPAWAAGLVYKFDGIDHPTYRVTVTGDLPRGISVATAYIRYAPSVSGDQIALPYRVSGRNLTDAKLSEKTPFRPGAVLFADNSDMEGAIESHGRVLKEQAGNQPMLSLSLGSLWLAALPPLSADGNASWTATRSIMLTEQLGADGNTQLATTQTFNCTDQPGDGNEVTAMFSSGLSTDLREGDVPVIHATGEGSFVFDSKHGYVKSLTAKYKCEVTTKNATVRVPVSLTVELLSDDAVAKLKADNDADTAKNAEANRKFHERVAAERKIVANELPAGVAKTASTGGEGGSPFLKVDAKSRPTIGFRIKVSEWGGHGTLGDVEPLYEKPTDSPNPANFKNKPRDSIDVLAREGYAVGGAFLSGPDYARAIRVIFMKKTASDLDPKASYLSPWYGELVGQKRMRVGGTGKLVAGIFGRKGLNMDQVGLLMFDDNTTAKPTGEAGQSKDPTDDPNFGGSPAAKP